MKPITNLVEVPIFNRSVFFIGNCSRERAEKECFLLKSKDSKIEFSHDSQGGVRIYEGDIFVWVNDLEKASVVAHELAHTAVSIMECVNIPLCADTEELMCYLIGWLKINVQDPVYKKFSKKKKKK